MQDRALTRSCSPPAGRGAAAERSRAATTPSTRSSPPTSPTRPAPRSPAAAAADDADDRRPAERRRASTGPGTRAAGRTPTATSAAPAGRTGTARRCRIRTRAAERRSFPNCPDKLFQYHHQPFNYFANYAPGHAGARGAPARRGGVPARSPPPRSSTCALSRSASSSRSAPRTSTRATPARRSGSDHLVACSRRSRAARCAKDTMVVVTYDEFGGQWDHVPPPGQGGAPGAARPWGPGTRIPALVARAATCAATSSSTTRSTTRRRSSRRSSSASASAARHARRGRPRPVDRLPGRGG